MRLPIGHSDFGKIILAKRDLVDKSLFIHEVVEDDAEVILITRPRRFGKTLNLSMLRYFFSHTVKGRYNGYQIGNNIIYNPWSIVNCIRDHAFQPYWVNTSDNALIKDILLHSDSVLRDELECLFKNQSIETIVDECFVYSDLKHADRSAVWSFLLMAGYLKIVSSQETDDGAYCQLAIPNMEIRSLYKKIITQLSK